MGSSFSVTKHNDLITSAYRLSLTEMQIILYGISLVNPVDGKFPSSYEIDIKQFGKMFNRDHGDIYMEVKDAIMKRFWEREFTFHDKYETDRKGDLVRARVKWVTTVKYSDKLGFLKIYFNPQIEEYLHNLKSNFTSYYIQQVSRFKSFYSVRIYEIAAMNLNRSKVNKSFFSMLIEDLRDIFDLTKKYSRFCDFKKWVLDAAVKEINALSDLNIKYTVLRFGRTPNEIKFSVTRPHPSEEEKRLNAEDEASKYHKRVSPRVIEKGKTMSILANTGWDIYVIEDQFYSFIKSKGAPDNLDGAFIGFVKKKIIKPPG